MIAKLRASMPARSTNLAPYILPLAITGLILIVFLGAVVHLSAALGAQFETGDATLNYQLTEGTSTFSQLQREGLYLLSLVRTPPDELDRADAELQVELLQSRYFQLSVFSQSPDAPPLQKEVARTTFDEGDTVLASANEWLANPEEEGVRETLAGLLIELDRSTNSSVLQFGRERVQSVLAFRDATNQAQAAFVLAGVSFIILMMALLFDVFSYLRQAQKTEAALQSIRFKDQFLAVMSHELRTPLNAIIGFLGIMKMMGTNSEKFPHMIDRSRANAERLLNLIDDILDMSKIEAGRFEIHPEPINPRELVNRWKTQTEILAVQKGLDFQCQLDDALPAQVAIDPDALSKIVTNLLSNALKFTEKGSVKLDIKAMGNQWQIRVTDSGIGIPQDMYEAIFESFRQVDSSIRRNFGGSGLGLSIVRQLTVLLGGQVKVESQVGVGSTFTVTLPLITYSNVKASPTPVQPKVPAAVS